MGRGDIYGTRLQIVHPLLRSWMGLRGSQEAHHDILVTLSQDPISLQKVYTIAQVTGG